MIQPLPCMCRVPLGLLHSRGPDLDEISGAKLSDAVPLATNHGKYIPSKFFADVLGPRNWPSDQSGAKRLPLMTMTAPHPLRVRYMNVTLFNINTFTCEFSPNLVNVVRVCGWLSSCTECVGAALRRVSVQ